MAELNWSDAQWQKANDAVTEAFSKASVANAFLPLYGPLAGSSEIVRNERLLLSPADSPTIRLDNDHDGVNLRLINLTVRVELTSEQVADETLANALLAFRRAANIIAIEQDRIVFDGFQRAGQPDLSARYVANQVGRQIGLADLPRRYLFPPVLSPSDSDEEIGRAVVQQVVSAIGDLENNSNPGPFACVLGNRLFNAVHTPSQSLVLPVDRIVPLLKSGRLFRSGTMEDYTGIVISLANGSIDIVIGTPPTVQFLQRQVDARYLFRVYERFVMRIRDEVNVPVAGFRFDTEGARRTEALTLQTRRVDERSLSAALATVATLLTQHVD